MNKPLLLKPGDRFRYHKDQLYSLVLAIVDDRRGEILVYGYDACGCYRCYIRYSNTYFGELVPPEEPW